MASGRYHGMERSSEWSGLMAIPCSRSSHAAPSALGMMRPPMIRLQTQGARLVCIGVRGRRHNTPAKLWKNQVIYVCRLKSQYLIRVSSSTIEEWPSPYPTVYKQIHPILQGEVGWWLVLMPFLQTIPPPQHHTKHKHEINVRKSKDGCNGERWWNFAP